MKWIKRISIVVVSLVLLLILLNFGLNWWISVRLPGIINRENDSPYQITYKDIDVSLVSRNMTATDIVVVPKSSLDSKKGKAGLYAKVKSVEVNGFGIWQIISGKRIDARSIVIDKPSVTLLKANERAIDNPKSISSEVVRPFIKIINVSDVFLNHGTIKITGIAKNKRILDVSNVNIKLEGIAITDQTLEETVPFTFKTYAIDCDSIFYKSSQYYHLVTQKIETTNNGLSVKGFKVIPEYDKQTFARIIPMERDLYAISASDIAVNNMTWAFKKEKLNFHATSVILDDVNANIFRSKAPKDDPKKKKLYSEMLRNIKFPMEIDTLKMLHSRVAYEETTEFGKSPGVLTFSKFNMYVTGLQSGYGQTKMPDVRIKILCNFMETSRLDVDWRFNVLDKADRFNIRGRFFNFPAEALSEFTKPYLNATFKGSLDEVYFNFNGNDDGAKGDFAINYDDLKVAIYKKKDKKKKNKIISAIANLFVKNDTKDKVTNAEISVVRAKDRSFFNLLWRSLEEGLKEILL
jgi:hypothetical protein